jgi:bla regulator protein blaR1
MIAANQLLATFLINSLWQIPLVAAAAGLCSALMRRAHSAYRHVLWVAALGLCLGLPLASLWSLTDVRSSWHLFSSETITNGSSDLGSQSALTHSGLSFIRKNHFRPVTFTRSLTWVFLGCYAGVFLYRAARIGWSLRNTLRFRDAAYCRALPLPLSSIAERSARAFGLRNVAITCSPDVFGPVTLSFPRAMLILPERFFTEVSESDFSSALCHELAHIRRHDFLLNLLYEFVSMPVSFHPATVWIKNRIALTREQACDEAATVKLCSRTGYARSLLNIAQSLGAGSSQKQSDWALGLFDTNTLEERIMNLLGKTNRMSRNWGIVLAAVASSLLTVTCMGISAFSLQVAQPSKPSADVQPFVGRWTAVYEGTPFMVLELGLEKGQLVGGMRMASNFHIDTDGSGLAIQINDKTLLESLPARNFKVTGKSLTFDYKDYDGDETHWKLEVSSTDAGRLSWVGLPDGMKASPIPVTKESAKSR